VRLSPLGTSATNWPIVSAPDDRWWVSRSWWNEEWQGKPMWSVKPCPSATLSTTNPTWPDLGSKSGRSGGKPATNRLSYGTATVQIMLFFHADEWAAWFHHFVKRITSETRFSVCSSVLMTSRGLPGARTDTARGIPPNLSVFVLLISFH
jgi:hypothetical protein